MHSLTFSSSANSPDNPNLEPQNAHAAEIGTKWNLLDERFMLTSALYAPRLPTSWYRI
jgi:catecholate siderophore receptor